MRALRLRAGFLAWLARSVLDERLRQATIMRSRGPLERNADRNPWLHWSYRRPPSVSRSRPLRRDGRERSDLLDLAEFEIDRRRPAEDRHRDLDPRTGLVDFLDHAVEGSERSVGDAHVFPDLEPDRRLGPLNPVGDLSLDSIGLDIGDRHRLLVRAEEAGHLRRVLDQVVDFVGEVALDQHVAREELSLRVDLAPTADFD